jgi:transposase-like protein
MDGEIEQLRPFDKLKLQPPQYVCPLCERTFKDEVTYKKHLVYEHKAQTGQEVET